MKFASHNHRHGVSHNDEKTPPKPLKYISQQVSGGEGGIRTHETVARLHAFQACAFDHSATSP